MTLKERVYEYVRKHPKQTEDEIAEELKIHVIDVLQALVELEREGKVLGF